jgi:ABC-type polysaccharide/polyol phosphate export permease
LITLQKKNTLLGFVIGLIPILVTALSIELFIGRIIGKEEETLGVKAINAIFFIFFSNAISQSTEALKKYGFIIKNSFLQPITVVIGESFLQYLSFLAALIIVSIVFKVTLINICLIFLISLLLSIYTLIVANYLVVVSSVLEDFGRILSIIFQMLFWVSPILYSIRIIKPSLATFFMINPFYIFFELLHLVFIPNDYNPHFFLPGVLSCFAFLVLLVFLLSNLRKKVIVFL